MGLCALYVHAANLAKIREIRYAEGRKTGARSGYSRFFPQYEVGLPFVPRLEVGLLLFGLLTARRVAQPRYPAVVVRQDGPVDGSCLADAQIVFKTALLGLVKSTVLQSERTLQLPALVGIERI